MRGARTTFALGLLLVLVAGALDAEPLWIPGVAFCVLSAGAGAWVTYGARGLRVTRTVATRTVLEDEPVRVDVVVRAAGGLALPTGVVDDPLLDRPAPLAAGRRQTTLHIRATFGRRGRKVLEPPRVVVRDPFGLASREVLAPTAPEELLVLPRTEPVRAAPGSDDEAGLAPRAGRPFMAAEVELDGLRPYRPGAPASRIAWQVWARSGELVERRLQADTDTRPLVVLDPRGAACEEDLDAAVRATASLAVSLAAGGGCALLLPGDRRAIDLDAALSGWPRAHVRLALLGTEQPIVAPSVAGLGSRRGAIVFVSARVQQRPPRALAGGAAAGARLLVVPGELGGRRAAFTVAGCSGYELGRAAGAATPARPGAGASA